MPRDEYRTASFLTVGQLAARSGVAASALRFYESIGLIASVRTGANHRRFPRATLRVVSIIRVAQGLGLSLDEIRAALRSLPEPTAPTAADWERLSSTWRHDLDARLARLERLRDDLDACIGCGCLSLERCALYNAGDKAAARGAGPRYLLGDAAAEIPEVGPD